MTTEKPAPPLVPLFRGPGHRPTGGSTRPPRREPRRRSDASGGLNASPYFDAKERTTVQSNLQEISLPPPAGFELSSDQKNKEVEHERKTEAVSTRNVSVISFASSLQFLSISSTPIASPTSSKKKGDFTSPSSAYSQPQVWNNDQAHNYSVTEDKSISFFVTDERSVRTSPSTVPSVFPFKLNRDCAKLIEREINLQFKEAQQFYDPDKVAQILVNMTNALDRLSERRKEGEKINANLSQELYNLRDQHIFKWRSTVLGEVVPFRCDLVVDSERTLGKLLHHSCLASKWQKGLLPFHRKNLRSNVVVIEALEKPEQQWLRRAHSKKMKGNVKRIIIEKCAKADAVPLFSLANYTEAQWKEEKKQLEYEMEMWKGRNSELQRILKQRPATENVPRLLSVSSPKTQVHEQQTMLVSSPKLQRVDPTTELRLALGKEEAVCKQLRVSRDAAEESCRRKRQQRAAQHSKKCEEETRAAEELRKMLCTLKIELERVKEKGKEEKNGTAHSFGETPADCLSQTLVVKRAETAVQRGYALLASLL